MKQILILYYLLFLIGLSGQSNALIIDERIKQKHWADLSGFIYTLPDSLSIYTIDEVVTPVFQDKFVLDSCLLNRSGMESLQSIAYHWIKISIQSSLSVSSDWFLFIDHPRYDIYLRDHNNQWRSSNNGILTEAKYPELPESIPAYKLILAPGQEQTLYLKIPTDILVVKTGITKKVDLKIFDSTYLNFIERNYWSSVNIILGIFLAVMGYHLIIYLYRRNKDYLYFALFVVSYAVIFSSFSKLISEWIIQGPANDYLILVVALGWTCMYLFHYLFTRRYLNLKYLVPWLNQSWKLILVLRIILSFVLASIAVFYGGMSHISPTIFTPILILAGIMGFMLILLPIIGAIKTLQQGWQPSIIYLSAMGAFVLQLLVEELNFQHIITLPDWYPMEFGSIAMVFLFALGLAKQMKMMEEDILSSEKIILKQEKEILQHKPIENVVDRINDLQESQQKLKVNHSNPNQLFQLNLQKIKNRDQHFVNQINHLMLDHLSDPSYGIPQLCDDMAMSRAQLYRKFSEVNDIPIGEYFRKLRLQKAYEMIKHSSLNITQISIECGFTNLSSFSRLFSEVYGISPSTIRKSML